jgi:hypothetical protein
MIDTSSWRLLLLTTGGAPTSTIGVVLSGTPMWVLRAFIQLAMRLPWLAVFYWRLVGCAFWQPLTCTCACLMPT